MAKPAWAHCLDALVGGQLELVPLRNSQFCETWQARAGAWRLFVKSAGARPAGMLHAEAKGLRALARTDTVRVPAVELVVDLPDGGAVLAMEWLDFVEPDAGFGRGFGQALAALHASPWPLQAPAFGWGSHHWLGATPQCNTPRQPPTRAGWLAFQATSRLGCMRNRLPPQAAELRHAIDAVIEDLPRLLAQAPAPRPALIHGDLWQGNWGMLADGTPVVLDPAVSCSDPGAELAMMKLFGSPPAGFRAGYEETGGPWPGPQCTAVYQLYHLLNHVVLFGGGYVRQALRLARSLA